MKQENSPRNFTDKTDASFCLKQTFFRQFIKRIAYLDNTCFFFFFTPAVDMPETWRCVKCVYESACELVTMGVSPCVNVLVRVWVSVWTCHHGCESMCECVGMCASQRANAFSIVSLVYTLPVHVHMWVSVRLSWQIFRSVWQPWRSFGSVRTRRSALFFLFLFFFAICTSPGTHCHPQSLLLSWLRSRSQNR